MSLQGSTHRYCRRRKTIRVLVQENTTDQIHPEGGSNISVMIDRFQKILTKVLTRLSMRTFFFSFRNV